MTFILLFSFVLHKKVALPAETLYNYTIIIREA